MNNSILAGQTRTQVLVLLSVFPLHSSKIVLRTTLVSICFHGLYLSNQATKTGAVTAKTKLKDPSWLSINRGLGLPLLLEKRFFFTFNKRCVPEYDRRLCLFLAPTRSLPFLNRKSPDYLGVSQQMGSSCHPQSFIRMQTLLHTLIGPVKVLVMLLLHFSVSFSEAIF